MLFPYALKALPGFLAQNWTSEEFVPVLRSFTPEAAASPGSLVAHVEALTAQNVKLPALKNLQGILWRAGYEAGEIVAPLYDDVLPALQAWAKKGLLVDVYSSGSVEAQELFFAYTNVGDVRGFFGAFFDTVSAGGKMDAASYAKIAHIAEIPVGEWLFLSDNVKEVEAAQEAGMKAAIIVREGNTALTKEDRIKHWVITNGFGELS